MFTKKTLIKLSAILSFLLAFMVISILLMIYSFRKSCLNFNITAEILVMAAKRHCFMNRTFFEKHVTEHIQHVFPPNLSFFPNYRELIQKSAFAKNKFMEEVKSFELHRGPLVFKNGNKRTKLHEIQDWKNITVYYVSLCDQFLKNKKFNLNGQKHVTLDSVQSAFICASAKLSKQNKVFFAENMGKRTLEVNLSNFETFHEQTDVFLKKQQSDFEDFVRKKNFSFFWFHVSNKSREICKKANLKNENGFFYFEPIVPSKNVTDPCDHEKNGKFKFIEMKNEEQINQEIKKIPFPELKNNHFSYALEKFNSKSNKHYVLSNSPYSIVQKNVDPNDVPKN